MFKNRPAVNANQGTATPKPRNLPEQEDFSPFHPMRDWVQRALLSRYEQDNLPAERSSMAGLIEELFDQYCHENNLLLSGTQRGRALAWVTSDIISYGPIDPLLTDESITEIMVNGPKHIFVEREGQIEEVPVSFEDSAHLRRIIDRIVAPLGRRVDEASPMVDARLPNGYRVNATIPPLSLDGPILTIRKFAKEPLTPDDLVKNGTVSTDAETFLKACVEARINTIISGGTGSGKTTFLNMLSFYIPGSERIITIEDAAELQLNQRHVIRLEKRPANVEGQGEITIRQLVINALRMRPDRIIVGESRGGEAFDMLQAMNTGHDGSMTTIHANSPEDAIRRVEAMVMMAGVDLPLAAIREQITSAIELVIHLERFRDGKRRVIKISEVRDSEDGKLNIKDLFVFKQSKSGGKDTSGLVPTGTLPIFDEKFRLNNVKMPREALTRKNKTGS